MVDIKNISLNFILSTGRTGSTLLSSMLNMHPEILSVTEEPFAYNLYPKYKNVTNWSDETIEQFCYDFYLFSEGKLPTQFGSKVDLVNILKSNKEILNGENAIKLAYFAFFPTKEKDNVKVIVDKQLKFHHFLEEVNEFYPNSKYIVLTRDPRDNVLVKMRKADKQGRQSNLLFFSKMWSYEYGLLLKKLSYINANQILRVSYEDLMIDPESTLKKVSAFLGVSYHENMMKYSEKLKSDMQTNEHKFNNEVKKHIDLLHSGLINKVSTDKMGIWKKEFSPQQYNTIWSICKDTSLKLGYQKDVCEDKRSYHISDIFYYFKFLVIKIIIPKLYYKLPYNLKYKIKTLKYSNQLKKGDFNVTKFIEKSLPKT